MKRLQPFLSFCTRFAKDIVAEVTLPYEPVKLFAERIGATYYLKPTISLEKS